MATFVKSMLITATFGVAAVLVMARPHEERTETPLLSLSDVVNKTMCPIVIHYDKNENRIPRIIKHLKCAETPNQLCTKTTHGCCKHRHHVKRNDTEDVHFTTHCVEIEDTVLVTFKGSAEPKRQQVSVGCTCMMQEVTKASEVD